VLAGILPARALAAEPAASPSPAAPAAAASPAPSGADAPEFGHAGQVTFSVWRLYGLSLDSRQVALPPDGKTYQRMDSTTLSLFGTDAPKPYGVPRLGADYFITDHFSIGAAGMFLYRDQQNVGPANLLVVTPRVSGGFALSKLFSIWVLGGVTWSRDATTQVDFQNGPTALTSTHVESGVAATLDAMLIVTPKGPFGFLVGPAADIGFAGNLETTKSARSIGLLGGLVAWLSPPYF